MNFTEKKMKERAYGLFGDKLYRVYVSKGKLYSRWTGYPMDTLHIEWWKYETN